MKELSGYVYENKGQAFHRREKSGNVVENKDSYAQNAGMLLKRKGVIGNVEHHATSNVHLISYPEHASTAREMEEAARSLFPTECLAAQEVEAA